MTKIIGPDRILTGSCGKYRESSGSLIPPGALERILAEAGDDGGEDRET